MADEYHEVANATDVLSGSDFAFPRSRALFAAIEKHRDYSIVQLQRRQDPSSEYIVADLEIDEIPPKNLHGIRYRERLVFCIPDDEKKLIDVRALRKDFPTLMHQNQTNPGDAPSLCLYFEPPVSVMRTWTPQNFLRRVQWWLEKTAKGELHPADQPVEQLFFVSKYELVLPCDFPEKLKDPNHAFRIDFRVKRPDDGATFFLEDAHTKRVAGVLHAECLEFYMPPVVHGVVERNPVTLGQLHDRLSGRGIDLLMTLKEGLIKRVGTQGVPLSTDNPCTIFLLHVPVCRTAGGLVETTHHHAFLVDSGPLKLGEEVGALFLHEKKYFNAKGILNAAEKTDWRTREILSVEVLSENNKLSARKQSGIKESGPVGVLIGAGSLGSAMLNLWCRAGWGNWTTIDKDHIKPHNLSRHTAYTQHIGLPKTLVAASLYSASISEGKIDAVFGDACDLTNNDILKPLKEATLIVDSSTTLEYPRQASTKNDLPRHISVFITPNGNSAVMLAEDDKRLIRLRTLEAQYYRAVIQNDWGKHHLRGNLGTFWSGASCRDISTVLPYSRVMAQTSTLAEQIHFASDQASAVIRIWERDPSVGSIVVHDVSANSEHCMKFGDLELFMDEGVERQLRELRTKSLPNETGGVLLGYYDFNIKAVFVICGLPAPSDSKSSPGMFERGVDGLAEAVNDATERTAGVVGYIGEWHSHPRNHSASPSKYDIIQLFHLAFGMADDGLPALQLIVGEHDIQILQGRVPP